MICYKQFVFIQLLLFFLYFFFQAEDGIRDLTVTGVQTCALPIYSRTRPSPSRGLCRAHARAVRRHHPASAIPECPSAGQVSGVATANSVKRGPNHVVESRVATGTNARTVSSSTAATGGPTRAGAPRWIAAQPGGGCRSPRLSRSGRSATSQVALPSPNERGDRPAAVGVDCGRTRLAREAAAARHRWVSQMGTAGAAPPRARETRRGG